MKKESNAFLAKFFLGVFISAVGFTASVFDLSSHSGFSPLWLLIPAALLLILALKDIRSWIILRALPRQQGRHGYVGGDQVAQRGVKNTVLVWAPTGDCTYPNCSGKICLEQAPHRERHRLENPYVGVCSVCGHDHSYRIDNTWTAHPEQFDWRPTEVPKKG